MCIRDRGAAVDLSKDNTSGSITCTNNKTEDYWLNGFSQVTVSYTHLDVYKRQVENTGESETWIRVKVEAKITSADDKELPVDVMDYEVSENWHMDFDGYIYYAKPVAPGESTEILFDTVYFAPEMGNEYQNCTANIVICAQAVQTANNGKNVLEAQGWPAEK